MLFLKCILYIYIYACCILLQHSVHEFKMCVYLYLLQSDSSAENDEVRHINNGAERPLGSTPFFLSIFLVHTHTHTHTDSIIEPQCIPQCNTIHQWNTWFYFPSAAEKKTHELKMISKHSLKSFLGRCSDAKWANIRVLVARARILCTAAQCDSRDDNTLALCSVYHSHSKHFD